MENNMSYFRRPKTTNERCQWEKVRFEEEESGEYVHARRSRSMKLLVDAWDDISKSYGWIRKSWKTYKRRSKQWDRSDIGR